MLYAFRASCRIRTNDPEITNHVLWPTELKRRVGKLFVSRRCTNYLCYVPVLEDSKGAGRTRLARFVHGGRDSLHPRHKGYLPSSPLFPTAAGIAYIPAIKATCHHPRQCPQLRLCRITTAQPLSPAVSPPVLLRPA